MQIVAHEHVVTMQCLYMKHLISRLQHDGHTAFDSLKGKWRRGCDDSIQLRAPTWVRATTCIAALDQRSPNKKIMTQENPSALCKASMAWQSLARNGSSIGHACHMKHERCQDFESKEVVLFLAGFNKLSISHFVK